MHRHRGGCRASTDSKFGFGFGTLHDWATFVESGGNETVVYGGEPQLSASQFNPGSNNDLYPS